MFNICLHLKALESKYDAVRDELLVLGLQQQHGAQWTSMSASMRHTHLLQAAMQYRQLAEEGEGNTFSNGFYMLMTLQR